MKKEETSYFRQDTVLFFKKKKKWYSNVSANNLGQKYRSWDSIQPIVE